MIFLIVSIPPYSNPEESALPKSLIGFDHSIEIWLAEVARVSRPLWPQEGITLPNARVAHEMWCSLSSRVSQADFFILLILPDIGTSAQPKRDAFAPVFHNLPEINTRQRYSHNKKIPVTENLFLCCPDHCRSCFLTEEVQPTFVRSKSPFSDAIFIHSITV
jgi:hypothetical protein